MARTHVQLSRTCTLPLEECDIFFSKNLKQLKCFMFATSQLNLEQLHILSYSPPPTFLFLYHQNKDISSSYEKGARAGKFCLTGLHGLLQLKATSFPLCDINYKWQTFIKKVFLKCIHLQMTMIIPYKTYNCLRLLPNKYLSEK